MPLIDLLLPEYDREIATTRAAIDAGRALDIAWRPEGGGRTLGALAAHLADIAGWTSIVMTHDRYDTAQGPDPRRAAAISTILDHFDSGASQGRAALTGRIDGELTATWSLERRGQTLFTLPRVAVLRVLVLNHLIHHRGQLSVYLRMSHVPVPSIYGPTANDSPASDHPLLESDL